MSKTFAYIRVSTREQKEDRQIDALKDYKVDEIIIEKASGKNFISRDEYLLMKSKMREGDLLIIHSIDRLGRNYKQICSEWEDLTKSGIDIQVLDMPILNTRENNNGLTGELICDIVLKLLGYVAERERDLIRARQKEGIESAKKRGLVKFGRPKVQIPETFKKAYKLYQNKLITLKEAMSMTGMPKSTFYDYIKRSSKATFSI